jgi:TPR repeat protein
MRSRGFVACLCVVVLVVGGLLRLLTHGASTGELEELRDAAARGSEEALAAYIAALRMRSEGGDLEARANLTAMMGTGFVRDNVEVLDWYARAWDLDAISQLGLMSEMGWGGVPQDLQLAAHWYALAADRGDVVSAARLNRLLASHPELALNEEGQRGSHVGSVVTSSRSARD